jgi:hypothetical protein
MGHIDEAARVLGAHESCRARDVMRCVLSFASRGVDDPEACARVIGLAVHIRFARGSQDCGDLPNLVWKRCARMGLVRVIGRLREFAGARRCSNTVVSQLDRADTAGWPRHAAEGLDPIGVLEAYGSGANDAEVMLLAALDSGRFDVADALLPVLARHGADRLERMPFVALLSAARSEVAAWAAANGYVPPAGHIQSIFYANPDPSVAIANLAATWPDVLISSACCVRGALASLLLAGDREGASRAVDALAVLPSSPAQRQERTVWDRIATASTSRRWCVRVHRNAFHATHGWSARCTPVARAVALAHIHRMSDPTFNPATHAVWRAWRGAPHPLDATEAESALLYLHGLGLVRTFPS